MARAAIQAVTLHVIRVSIISRYETMHAVQWARGARTTIRFEIDW